MTKNFLIALVIVAVIGGMIPWFIRTYLWSKFLNHVKKGEDEKALKVIQSKAYRWFLGGFDQDWNLLRFYMSRDNKKMIEEQTNKLLYSNLNNGQRYKVCSNVFFYYLGEENKEMCEKLLEELDKTADEKEKQEMHMLYRVLIEKKAEDIDNVMKAMEERKDELERPQNKAQLGILQYLLGLQYRYQKNRRESDLWLTRAKENLKGTPYEKTIKELLH